MFLKPRIRKLRHWFKQLQEIRDEWIHRSSIRCLLIHGESKVGVLPVPRKVALPYDKQFKLAVTENNFWSTKNFVEYHYSNLLRLFLAIVERCIQIEQKELTEPVPVSPDAEKNLALFPIRLTKRMIAKKMKVRIPESVIDW